MSDPFQNHARGLDSPASRHATITPSDTADIPVRPRVIFCQTSGSLVLRDGSGTDISYTVTAGQILPLSAVRVLATGTTATVIGWW